MLTFLVQCPACHALVASVQVDPDGWHEAELWAFVAAAEHREECPAAPGPFVPTLSTGDADLSTLSRT